MGDTLFDLDGNSEYQKLAIARDLAAYRALGHTNTNSKKENQSDGNRTAA